MQALSSGNQQRVQLALALLNDPELLVLDEPFSGREPVAAVVIVDHGRVVLRGDVADLRAVSEVRTSTSSSPHPPLGLRPGRSTAWRSTVTVAVTG